MTSMWKHDWQQLQLQNKLEKKWRNILCWGCKMGRRENGTILLHSVKMSLSLCHIFRLLKTILFSHSGTQMRTQKWKVRQAIKWSVHGCCCGLQKKKWIFNQNHKFVRLANDTLLQPEHFYWNRRKIFRIFLSPGKPMELEAVAWKPWLGK